MHLPYLKFLDPLPETHFFIWPYLKVMLEVKTCLQGFQLGHAQTSLLSFRD